MLLLAGSILMMVSCSPTTQVSEASPNLAALYNPSEFSLNSDFRVFHNTDNISTLYIRLFPSELLFNQANKEGEYRAVVKMRYSLFQLGQGDQIIAMVDSSETYIKLGKKEQERAAYISSLSIPVPFGSSYLLKVELSDIQRGTNGLRHIYIDKQDRLNAQNFSIVSARTGVPKFMDYNRDGEVFSIHYQDRSVDKLYLDFYKDENELPRPPVRKIGMTSFPETLDTTIVLELSDTIIYTLPGKGKYHFRVDSNRMEGLTMYNYGNTFPQIRDEEDMVLPLFYIAYPVEYSNLRSQFEKKLALDEFWLRRTSNMDRSRELIRIYYNRVLYSNIYFTADKEGWKTDRGMIYILFGPPDRMKDTGTSQNWYYISNRRGQVYEFRFKRNPDLFTNEVFYLEKDPLTMKYLDEAIRSWNNGKVHSLKN